MTIGYLVAWYFFLFIQGQEYPLLIGPYHSRNDCVKAERIARTMGYETEACTWMNR